MNNTRRLWLMTLMSIGMVFSYGTSAEEEDITKPKVKVADEFKRGDVISAETFNQIFRTIERINTVIDDDFLEGSWNCVAIETSPDAAPLDFWTALAGGILYRLEDAQVNFTKTDGKPTIEAAGSFSTSTPSPIVSYNPGEVRDSSGSYALLANRLFFSYSEPPFAGRKSYTITKLDNESIAMNLDDAGAGNWVDQIVCRKTNGLPASPTNPSATNKKTSVDVAWTDASDDETGFNVYRTLSGEETATLVAQVTDATYTDNDLEEGQAASYYITSYNENGESAKSKVVTATLDSIAPTLVSTTPANGDDIATDDRQLTLTFNEKVEIFCPSDPSSERECATDIRAVTGNWLDDRGNERTFSIGNVINSGFGGSLTISGSMMGSAELFGANQSVTATVNKAVIRDVNGNVMETDYEFTFTVNDTQNNPNCPPNC